VTSIETPGTAANEERARIVVALDGSQASWAAARLALDLAAQYQGVLEAIFVLEPEVCRLPATSVARARRARQTHETARAAKDLTAELDAFAEGLRERFEAMARRRGVEVLFRVARGEARTILGEAAAVADALAVGRVGWAMGRGRALGSTAAALSLRAAVRLLPLRDDEDALIFVLRPQRLGLEVKIAPTHPLKA
jgi:nucleotide-binding universal stress UspA family protein